MTRAQLGAKLGVNPKRIQEYEAGEDRISSDLLRSIVAHMAVSPAFFFDGLASALATGGPQRGN
jgi:transcriptional regulator with XRE-family HTH domain